MGKLWLTAPLAAALLATACHTGSHSMRLAFSERETQPSGNDYARPVHYAKDMTDIDAATGDDAAWAKSYAFHPTRRVQSTPSESTIVLPDSEDATAVAESPTIAVPANTENASADAMPASSNPAIVAGQD